MPDSLDALAEVIYRVVADYGPMTAPAVARVLGEDARRVSNAMARLLAARRLVVAGVTPADEPLYVVATKR
jgi:hypothetical protein